MRDMQWTTIDKSTWPRGPWDQEPDKVQWIDRATLRPCLIVRAPRSGALCGYVGVSEGHPLFGKNSGARSAPLEMGTLDVHGGVTFTGFCQPAEDPAHGICHIVEEGENDRIWWIGFDCSHGGDLSPNPRSENLMRELLGDYSGFGGEYRNLEYVKGECRDLARQLKALQA